MATLLDHAIGMNVLDLTGRGVIGGLLQLNLFSGFWEDCVPADKRGAVDYDA